MLRPSSITGVFSFVLFSRFTVCGVSKFFCLKPPQIGLLSCNRDLSHPWTLFAVFNRANTFESRFIVFLYRRIRVILTAICFPQVRNPIVRTVQVAMVNFIFRPLPCHVQPCEAVGKVCLPVNPNISVADPAVDVSCHFSNSDFMASLYPPSKNPTLRAIIENRFQVFLSQFHDAPPVRIGISGAVASNCRSAILTQMTRSGGGYRTVKR